MGKPESSGATGCSPGALSRPLAPAQVEAAEPDAPESQGKRHAEFHRKRHAEFQGKPHAEFHRKRHAAPAGNDQGPHDRRTRGAGHGDLGVRRSETYLTFTLAVLADEMFPATSMAM